MITDDLVQFIRSGRASGMSEEELERLLITEGGWDPSDVDEARRKLDEPAVSPSDRVLPNEQIATVLLPVESPQATAVEFTEAPTPKQEDIPHDDFQKLISSVKATPGVPAMQTGEEGPQQQLEEALNPTPVSAALPKTTEKKESWSIGSILGVGVNNTKKEAKPTDAPVSPAPIKFDLSALRASPMSEKSRSDGDSASSVHREESGTPSSTKEEPTPLDVLLHGGGPKKTDLKAKRTMASDLLLHASHINKEPKVKEKETPPPVAPVVSEPTPPHDPFVVEIKNTQHTEEEKKAVTNVAVSEPSPFDDKLSVAPKTKRILLIVLGVASLLLVVGGGIFTFMKLKTPDSGLVLSQSFHQFFSTPSFTYTSEIGSDVVLSGITGGEAHEGIVKFTLGSLGTPSSGVAGFGDGVHKIKFSGGWQLDSLPFTTNTELEVRMIAGSLYVHMLTLPAESTLDPELFKSNWIKIEFADIASVLNLSGATAGTEGEYGNFGGAKGASAFMTLLGTSMPITATGASVSEIQNEVTLLKTPILLNPDTMFALVQALYKKNTNKELVLTEEQKVRLKGAFRKVGGFVWTDKKSGALVKVSLTANFDDDIVSVHAKGPVYMQFSFSKFGVPPVVETPAPSLTLPELKVYMEESQKKQEKRARDQVHVERTNIIASALTVYRAQKGRYPKELTDLYAGGMLATTTLDLPLLKEFSYRSYQKESGAKRVACTGKGAPCGFYHLGVNLEDASSTALSTDADVTSAILGADTAGCGGEVGFACYDVTSLSTNAPAPTASPVSAPTTAPQTATPSIDQLSIDRMKARDTKRITALNELSTGLALYFGQHKAFPETLAVLVDEQLVPAPLPVDPLDGTAYAYHAIKDSTGKTVTSFVLGASLEDGTNPALTSSDDKDAKDSVIKTSDETGCNGEKGRHCYDI